MVNGIMDGYECESDHVVPMGIDRASGHGVQLALGKFNRHGLIAGATGTGKTRTVQGIAEYCAMNGVPVVLSDGKGDLSGMAKEGTLTGRAMARAEETAQSAWWKGTSVPVQFLAPGGMGEGVRVRMTVRSFGYRSMAKLAKLSPAQTAALHTVFREADLRDQELENIEDLRDYIRSIRDDSEISVSPRVCDNLTNALNLFEDNHPGLFGGPEFDVMDLLRKDDDWGMVSIIDNSKLSDSPEVLTTFLLWVMKELGKSLPEVGDQELPKLVIFLDEAGLMFQDAPKEFVQEVLRMVKSIRSKGVGVFFISQSSADIPEAILEQCSNRIQHALRAITPKQMRMLAKTADTFPVSAVYDIQSELNSMAIGEALVCVIDDEGRPTPPAVTLMYVPLSSMSPLSEDELRDYVRNSLLYAKYRDMERQYRLDREDTTMPPEPAIRVREETPAVSLSERLRGLANGRQGPADAVPVGYMIDDDPWNT